MRKTIISLIVLFTLPLYSQIRIPAWAEGIVWYQIFPERFANGDAGNEPTATKVFINQKHIPEGWKPTPWTSNWFAQAEWEQSFRRIRDVFTSRRYGGDLQGIINRLDYIKELGVGGMYLNPVFDAVSMHKYDGSTYHHIDIHFGPDPERDLQIAESERPDDPATWQWTAADSLFLTLLKEAKQRGIRLIIDGVLNHTGTQFWAFRDILKNGINSRYRDWYLIKSFDDPTTEANEFDYKGWWGIKSLPEFNRTEDNLHPEVRAYIFAATRRWMDPNGDGDPSDGIDGWRLDVSRDVPLGFWKEWSALVRSINPDAIIVGELWEHSPEFVGEDGPYHSLMNYNFAFAVNDYLVAEQKRISRDAFIDSLKKIDHTYPAKNLHVLQNLLTSHDTERLGSLIENPDRNYDRDANEGNPAFNPGKPSGRTIQKQKLITIFQMVYRGAPMIYYGDEVGMWGADDPHCRKPMVWDDLKYDDEVISEESGFPAGIGTYPVGVDHDLLQFYQQAIALRNSHQTLKTGNAEVTGIDGNDRTFAVIRKGDATITAFFNPTDTPALLRLPEPGTAGIDLLTKEPFDGTAPFTLPAWGYKIVQSGK